MRRIALVIFLISAAVLGLELALVRILSVAHWHHFSYLVISTALLGFGSGGVFVSLSSAFLRARFAKSIWILALGMAILTPLVFHISQHVRLDELQLIWDRRQILYLLVFYLLFFVPFFFGGTLIALAFAEYGGKAPRLYFYNMTGSGLGAAGAVALMYFFAAQQILLFISATAFAGALVAAYAISRRDFIVTLFIAAAFIFLLSPVGPFELELKISENKSLVYYRAIPEAAIIAVRHSPMARLDCVTAPAIRYFPGLSIAYTGSLPEQALIISDADGISAVNHFEDVCDLDCYRHTSSALAYHLLEKPHVCIIGSGGGSDVAQAIAFDAASVTAVEMNPQIIELVENQLRSFSSSLYQRSDVKVVIAEGRNFLQTAEEQFDLINISLLDSLTASSAGLYALNESHLYTRQAIEQALARLGPSGLLSITRPIKLPPRDSLKMLATIVEALANCGIDDASAHVAMIRGWSTATIIASKQPLSQSQIRQVREFASLNSFDLVQVPGIVPAEANRFELLEQPVYYLSAQQILSDKRSDFYHKYPYNIHPATDDRPYFFDFFKWKTLPYMVRSAGRHWLIFSEWGYLVLVITLAQAIVVSALLILLPLALARPITAIKSNKSPVLFYFVLLGLAYMFLEMGFIQRLTLLIGHPVLGVAVTLVGFLVFSGCGALTASGLVDSFRRDRHIIYLAVAATVLAGTVEVILLRFSFNWLMGYPRPARLFLGLLIIGPPAFFMGMPFPVGLRCVHLKAQPLVPWAWGVNGFASVVAAVLGTCLATSLGFTTLALIALTCYLIVALISRKVFT